MAVQYPEFVQEQVRLHKVFPDQVMIHFQYHNPGWRNHPISPGNHNNCRTSLRLNHLGNHTKTIPSQGCSH